MDPERGQLESPYAGTGFETPGQQCLPNWEMGRTTVEGCLLVGVSLDLGGNNFSLTELAVGARTNSKTATPSALSKTVFLQMSRKPGDSEPASEENKQFDPGGKEENHRFEKWMYWYSFLFLGELWAWMPGMFLCLCFSVVYCSYQVIIFSVS